MHVKSFYKMTLTEWLKFVASHHPVKAKAAKPKGTGRKPVKWLIRIGRMNEVKEFEIFAFTKSEARAIVKKKIGGKLPAGTFAAKV